MEFTLYLPRMDQYLNCSEGTGDNLLDEDIEAGFVDYAMTDLWYYDDEGEVYQVDGGQWMLEKPFHDVYKTKKQFAEAMLENHGLSGEKYEIRKFIDLEF